MIIKTTGAVINLTATANDFNISTPVSVKLNEMNIPDGFIIRGIALFSAVIIGSIGISIISNKLLFKRR